MRVTSVGSMVYFKVYILKYSFGQSHHKDMKNAKVLDMLITLSRSLYNVKTPRHHTVLVKYAQLLCVNQK